MNPEIAEALAPLFAMLDRIEDRLDRLERRTLANSTIEEGTIQAGNGAIGVLPDGTIGVGTTWRNVITNVRTIHLEVRAEAATAQESADRAQRFAENARERAIDARTRADNAQSTANDARQRAVNAQSSANSAQSSANSAQSTANDARQRAINAQSAAGNAAYEAAIATQTANSANQRINAVNNELAAIRARITTLENRYGS